MRPENRFIAIRTGMLIFALLGVFDASYLAIQHYRDAGTICFLTDGCDIVLQSQYATVLANVPTALLGVFYYTLISVLLIMHLVSKKEELLRQTAQLTVMGFLFSLWLVYLQIFAIQAICAYCMISAASSTMLFVLGMAYLSSAKKNKIVLDAERAPAAK